MEDNPRLAHLQDLWKADRATKLVNMVTLYRIVTFPVLLLLIFLDRFDIFQWMLVASFLTDAADGHLARRYKVSSVLGSRLDSLGDDLTLLAAILGLAVYQPGFLREQWWTILVLLILFFVQIGISIAKYGKMTSFHTYFAKLATVFQGFFLCSIFLFGGPAMWLYYLTVIVTAIELAEEIIMVILLRAWRTNVHGLYWLVKEKMHHYSRHEVRPGNQSERQ